MDRNIFLERMLWKNKQKFKVEDIERGMGFHHRLSGDQAIAAYTMNQNATVIPNMFRHPPVF